MPYVSPCYTPGWHGVTKNTTVTTPMDNERFPMSDPRTLEEREGYVSIRVTNGKESYKIYLDEDSSIEDGLRFTRKCLQALMPGQDGLSKLVGKFTDGVYDYEVIQLWGYDD